MTTITNIVEKTPGGKMKYSMYFVDAEDNAIESVESLDLPSTLEVYNSSVFDTPVTAGNVAKDSTNLFFWLKGGLVADVSYSIKAVVVLADGNRPEGCMLVKMVPVCSPYHN